MPSLQGLRDTVWPELCHAMHGWLKDNAAQRALRIDPDRPSWVSHETFYGHWMTALCLHLRWAREKWIRTLFHSLCLQFQVDTAEKSAGKLRVCMDRDDSIIYVGFSFSSRRPYYGLVEARKPHERWVEHLRATRQHQTGLMTTKEEKYAYMAAHGGISQWFFLPYISCGTQIELSKLRHPEQSVIRRFPAALNKCRHHASPRVMPRSDATVDKMMQSVARKAAREGQYDSRVDTAVSYVNRADATVPEVTHLINTAMNTCLTIAWHSSYPWSTTQSERRWGDSMVVLMDEAGNFIYGKLRLALTHKKRWPARRRLLGFLHAEHRA